MNLTPCFLFFFFYLYICIYRLNISERKSLADVEMILDLIGSNKINFDDCKPEIASDSEMRGEFFADLFVKSILPNRIGGYSEQIPDDCSGYFSSSSISTISSS